MKPAQLQIAEFYWRVAAAGHEWKQSMASRPHLYERNVPGKGARIYQPLVDTPGLFRDFADLRGKDNIRAFADQFGILFDRYAMEDHVKEKGTFRSTGALCGTWLAVWEREIEDIRALVSIWDSITSARIADLKHIIFWREGKGVEYKIKTPKHQAGVWLTMPGVPNPFREGDLLLPAQYALQREINRRLSGELNQSELHEITCVPCLAWTADGTQILTIMPPNLLGAMWLQFAQYVSGVFQLKRCPGCNRYFQSGAGAKRRADAVTCSDACRQRKKRESA